MSYRVFLGKPEVPKYNWLTALLQMTLGCKGGDLKEDKVIIIMQTLECNVESYPLLIDGPTLNVENDHWL